MRRLSLLAGALLLALALTSCGKTETAVNHEGEIGAPVLLTVGTTHIGTVGGDVGDDYSYYYFVATSTSQFISLTNATENVEWRLYSDAGYTTLVAPACISGGSGSASCTVSVTPGTVYYLRVYNNDFGTTTYYLTIT